ncbi:response regulator transcription factor [Peptacetobacter hiranonis]|uniref:Stage 0 sporulation protein A homolog n=1 Tax=Peptacetobacter hiranonis (strain DSM 13275 / JCM 10541 / KCTC 15199 / TO-931) TaxID=500633 RepID=B6FXJ9_PEPHT|nr:response regulator transcription factor [Peptacetobacter hiranonis]EEA85747.1 response regulator receiver domain protein [Peptacetobacter hiranonis DSM 13275]QEK20637.1 Transcriptional regulatory protein WalR [Peptacetobacter hiranonis]
MKKILIADDDKELCKLLQITLKSENIDSKICFSGIEAINELEKDEYIMLILDVMMPGLDGFRTLEIVRENSDIPVLMLTAKDDTSSKVKGLRLGADDYITKPFNTEEFLARVDSLIRRYNMNNKQSKNTEDYRESLYFEGLEILPDEYSVKTDKGMIELLPKEFDVLYFCAINQGRILTKKQIYEAVWNESYAFDDNNIMSVISRIRKKIEEDSSNPKYIQTVKGIGYRFNKGV